MISAVFRLHWLDSQQLSLVVFLASNICKSTNQKEQETRELEASLSVRLLWYKLLFSQNMLEVRNFSCLFFPVDPAKLKRLT